MKLRYVPLLEIQRKLCAGDRSRERFQQYIDTMRGATHDDMELPLSAFNPMAKGHVAKLLDQYLEMGADEIAEQAVGLAASKLGHVSGEFRVALVIADDAEGGWTNRYATEFDHRFDSRAYLRRGWTTGLLWTSELPNADQIHRETLSAVFRAVYVCEHGLPKTVAQMLAQSQYIATNCGTDAPEYRAEELRRIRMLIQPHLESRIKAHQIACLFGDDAALQLGYKPLGLGNRAGFALAAQDVRDATDG